MSFLAIFTIISFMLAAADICIVFLTDKKDDYKARFLSWIGIFAAIAGIAYLLSIYHFSYFLTSVFSSIYFVCIDAMLVSFLAFLAYFTDFKRHPLLIIAQKLLQYFLAFEILEFAINPFFEVSAGYDLANYSFIMRPLFVMHLVYTYGMVIIIMIILVWQAFTVPVEYRRQFTTIIHMITVLVLINAAFLFLPDLGLMSHIDYSMCVYSFTIYAIYWSAYVYRNVDMLKGLSMTIFDNIDQGILLFDYNRKILMLNDRAKTLLAPINPEGIKTVTELSSRCGISPCPGSDEDSVSLQCFLRGDESNTPLRCDCRRITGRRNRTTGYLFVFTDLALSTDLLTDFHNYDSFVRFAADKPQFFSPPSVVCICDINSLTKLNSTLGHEEGDRTISDLADNMRVYLPEGSYFVRGSDAKLIAICPVDDVEAIRASLQSAIREVKHSVQYAVIGFEGRHSTIIDAINEAEKAMSIYKLTDPESAHSQILATLIRALEETDPDTRSHVLRTQESGRELGRRLGLTDLEQAELTLLCLLHDIGKIGVPLEILNKPGRLSSTEWTAMCSHVEKGYNIAVASPELSCIADMILHHHERWDGRGYPNGIKGESIPLLSRIIAVIDAYDAMVHDRCYRKAISVDAAKLELESCSGSQFDPRIVSQFLDMLKEKTFVEPSQAEPAETLSEKSNSAEIISPIFNSHMVPYTRYFLDANNFVLSTDDSFELVTGYSEDDVRLLHLNQMDLIPREDVEEYKRVTAEILGRNGFGYLEHRIMRKDGSITHVLCYGRYYFDSSVKEMRSEIIVAELARTYGVQSLVGSDDSAVENSYRLWQSSDQTDKLTSLMSHAFFSDEVERRISDGRKRVLLLMLDIDNFGEVNRRFGLHMGDKFLVFVAQTLRSALRSTDLACRLGGDEFAVALFFDLHAPDSLLIERAQQIFDKVSFRTEAEQNGCSISMGAAFTCKEINTFQTLYQETFHSLYVSKQSGKARLTVAPGDSDE